MGSGYKNFTAASVLTAADLNNYCQSQSVMYFASTAARDAAITSPVAGMVAFIDSGDANEGLYVYHGATGGWRKGPGWNAPWGVQLYAQDTVNTRDFTGTPATITNITGSVSVVNNRRYRCTFQCRYLNTSTGAANTFTMRAGGTGFWSGIENNYSNINDQIYNAVSIYSATSSSTLTFDVQASAGTGTLKIYGANAATQFTVEDIGPYGAPA
jgi:hypothetical protein